MTIRASVPADVALAVEWAGGHGRAFALGVRVPEIGCTAEDGDGPIAVVYAYRCEEMGIAFIESLITRPGIDLRSAVAAGEMVMRGIGAALKSLGYSTLVAYSLPACARYLRRMGWEEADERPKIAMFKQL